MEGAPGALAVKPLAASGRRGAKQPRTIPEQVADQLALAIIQGQYLAGERILEQKLSDQYRVSRGTIREALRSLEKRALIEFYPRRGAYAIGVSLNLFADYFNVRSALIGMAARCLTLSATPERLEELDSSMAVIRRHIPDADAMTFAQDVSAVTRAIYVRCGNVPLARILREQVENSLWGMVWRAQALDFHSQDRRRQAVRDWAAVMSAVRSGAPEKAERLTREAMARSRNAALATLGKQRAETVDPDKLFKDSGG